MLTAVKLVDQWHAVERRLPSTWESVSLRLRTEQPDELGEAARILGPMNVGRVDGELAVTIRRAGGQAGPEAARRLFARLDAARIWCVLEQESIADSSAVRAPGHEPDHGVTPLAEAWDAALGELPVDWSDLVRRARRARRSCR